MSSFVEGDEQPYRPKFCYSINTAAYHLGMGRGGSQVVSVLAFYSDDPSSNPAVD